MNEEKLAICCTDCGMPIIDGEDHSWLVCRLTQENRKLDKEWTKIQRVLAMVLLQCGGEARITAHTQTTISFQGALHYYTEPVTGDMVIRYAE